MKFKWESKEKEKFYQRAEKELRDAKIDFIKVDRNQFGVKGWDEKKHTVEKVYIFLESYSYQHLSADKKKKLKTLGNWECLNESTQKWGMDEKQIFMHSRLVYQN